MACFRSAVAEHVGEGRARLLTCDFSTTTAVERAASEILLLDAYSPYFDYELSCVCGIPELTLLGSEADWRSIRERIDVLSELELGFWTPSLSGIANQLLIAAAGRPNVEFFRDIYEPQRAYGWDRIAGWVARFYPYVAAQGKYTHVNPLLELPLDFVPPVSDDGWYRGPGISARDVLARMGSCLIREARLFEPAWWLRPQSAYERILVTRSSKRLDHVELRRFIDLPNGSLLALGSHFQNGPFITLLREAELDPLVSELNDYDPITGLKGDGLPIPGTESRNYRQPLDQIPVVARSIADLLDLALSSNGNVELAPQCMLSDLVKE